MDKILVIGIAGGTGSGKTTLTNRIAEQFQDRVTIVKHDNYYKAHDDMTYEDAIDFISFNTERALPYEPFEKRPIIIYPLE